MLAGLMLFPLWTGVRSPMAQLKSHSVFILQISFLQTVLLYALFFIGINMTRGSSAAVVSGAAPLFTAVIAHLITRNEKLTPGKFLILLIGLLGISLISISAHGEGGGGKKEILGLLFLSGSVCSSALSNVLISKKKLLGPHPLVLNAAQIFFGGTILFAAGICVEGVPEIPRVTKFYYLLLWLSFISAAAFTLWFRLLKTVPVASLNVWKFLLPVFGVILSWIFTAGESPDILTGAGTAAVALSILLYHLIRKPCSNGIPPGCTSDLNSRN